MSEKKEVVRFHVTAERLNDIEFGVLLDITGDAINYQSAAEFLALFAADADGNYLETDVARLAVRKLTIGELMPTVNRIAEEMQQVAAPNA